MALGNKNRTQKVSITPSRAPMSYDHQTPVASRAALNSKPASISLGQREVSGGTVQLKRTPVGKSLDGINSAVTYGNGAPKTSNTKTGKYAGNPKGVD